MSDGALIAVIGFFTVLVAGVPTTAAALLSRQARDHAATAATVATQARETLGEKNGNGDLMQINERNLVETGQILRALERAADTQQELIELHDYSHAEIHRINGMVGMMWAQWAKDHNLDPDYRPPPVPSPKE